MYRKKKGGGGLKKIMPSGSWSGDIPTFWRREGWRKLEESSIYMLKGKKLSLNLNPSLWRSKQPTFRSTKDNWVS